MKNKKLIMGVTFIAGLLLFITTALADITATSAYESYKDAVKNTAKSFTSSFDNFTLEFVISLKDENKVIVSQRSVHKTDIKNNATERMETLETPKGDKEDNYYYFDSDTRIYYSPTEKTYNVTELTSKSKDSIAKTHYRNPFEEERAKDVEKVFDALVGDLRNYGSIQENDDGSKAVIGSVNESQIPPVINAIASFGVKQFINDTHRGNTDKIQLPVLTDEIYIKKVNVNGSISKDNIAESSIGTLVISGKDSDGNIHELTLDLVAKIYDINTTKVVKPDLTGKKVVKSKEMATYRNFTIDKRYLGKWTNDVIELDDDTFTRVASRILDIESIDDKIIKGKYIEKNYNDQTLNKEFSFEAKITGDTSAEFDMPSSEVKNMKVMLHFSPTEIYFSPLGGRGLEHGQFHKLFEN